jgi:hypothetical protein
MKNKTQVSKDLIIEPTRTTFGIEFFFEQRLLRFSGDSYPENAFDFFNPLLQWIKKLVNHSRIPVLVEFRVNYFNTSSSKYLFQILEMLHAYRSKGNTVSVTFFMQENGDDTFETWRELMDELELPFEKLKE